MSLKERKTLFSDWNHGVGRTEVVPAVLEIFKKKTKEFCRAEDQACLRKKFAHKMLPKARRKLVYEEAKHYHKDQKG